MKHQINEDDLEFRRQVESCEFPVAEFSHRAHLRLGYIYLVNNDAETSVNLMRDTLHRLLVHNGVEPGAKYHETLTKAWILAVHHFMNSAENASSADQFIDANPKMLDSRIMMTHYSAAVLFSDEAREVFVQTDREPIPQHDD